MAKRCLGIPCSNRVVVGVYTHSRQDQHVQLRRYPSPESEAERRSLRKDITMRQERKNYLLRCLSTGIPHSTFHQVDGYTRTLQRTLQMYSLPVAPGIRLAESDTPEATTQSDRSHKHARLTGNRDDSTYYSLLALRPSAASGLMCNIPK